MKNQSLDFYKICHVFAIIDLVSMNSKQRKDIRFIIEQFGLRK